MTFRRAAAHLIVLVAVWSPLLAQTPWLLQSSQDLLRRNEFPMLSFRDSLWIVGGIYAQPAGLNDVWNSPDGNEWTQVPCSYWLGRWGHAAAVFNDKIYILGGNTDGGEPPSYVQFVNDVWWSDDGRDWCLATPNADWTPRTGHTALAFHNKLWVIGGRDSFGSYSSAVWSSVDGATWNLECNAPWRAREDHASVVFDGAMWVIGGKTGTGDTNDAWFSTDGTNWNPATLAAPWSPRSGHEAVVYGDKLWILGGFHSAGDTLPPDQSYLNEVWYSNQGVTWTQTTPSPEWGGRAWFGSSVHRGRIYIAGGFNYHLGQPCDLWFYGRDVACTGIRYPAMHEPFGHLITPGAYFTNFGSQYESYTARFRIGDVYDHTIQIEDHPPGETQFVYFDDGWFTADCKTFPKSCSTELSADACHGNDKDASTVEVVMSNWTLLASLQANSKPVKGGGGIVTLCGQVVALVGNNTPDFIKYSIPENSWMALPPVPTGLKNKKVKTGAYIVDDDSATAYVFKGGGTNEFYAYDLDANAWTTLPDAGFLKRIRGGFACVVDRGESSWIYAGCGSNNNEWKRFNLLTRTWESPSPAALPVEKAKAGSGLCFDGRSKLYFLQGGGRANEFYVTDLDSGALTWTPRSSLPLEGPSSRKKKVKEGGCIEYFDWAIYAVKGGNTQEFWRYLPAFDTWEYVGQIGNGLIPKGIKCGRSLAASPTGVYCLVGNNTNDFCYYGMPPESSGQYGGGPTAKSALPKRQHALLSVAPNPSSGTALVNYSLPRPGKFDLKLYDMSGVLRATLVEGQADAERHEYAFRVADGRPAVDLPRGVYVMRLELDGSPSASTCKLIVE